MGSIIICILINILPAYLAYRFDLPIFLDTVGTMIMAMLGGFFPSIFVAVLSNIASVFFKPDAIYFGVLNSMIALITIWFTEKHNLRKMSNAVTYILCVGTGSGVIAAFIQWGILGGAQNVSVTTLVNSLERSAGLPQGVSFFFITVFLNIIDKAFCLGIALLITNNVPADIRKVVMNIGWKQRPLSIEEVSSMDSWSADTRHSMKKRMAMMLSAMFLLLMTIIVSVSMHLFLQNEIEEKTETAKNAARLAASVVDGSMIDEYIAGGETVQGYSETEDLLYKIRESAPGIEYLYVLVVDEEKCTFVFDLDAKQEFEAVAPSVDNLGNEPGTVVPVEDAFKPYLDDLINGIEIEPVASNSKWNRVVTAYYPIRNSNGKLVAYAGADASVEYLLVIIRRFMMRILLIIAGVLILIVVGGLYITAYYTIYPVDSIAMWAENFIKAGSDQKSLDENVKKLRNINIHTSDEVEKLYYTICDMALNQTEQMRSIRRFSDNTAKMQDGLIITMADLVENRDSDTGAHIQKTVAYVKIIVEGLKKKGYYAGKITDKFISDCARSAPLHDVGKINIPDSVLNKPGKLTDEEYEIIKTHTIAGKKIMEKAIDTVGGENYLKEARNMAAYHHERWDGKGYPEGLHGEVIPLSARIMAVADVFDALTSPRIYKPPFPVEEALKMIQDGAGTQFDPKCVEVFMDSLPEIKVVLRKYNQNF